MLRIQHDTMAKAHRGNPVYSTEEVIEYLKENGASWTAELAEEFDVSVSAVHQRLEELDAIEKKKNPNGNQVIWFVPHETKENPPTADGGLTHKFRGLDVGQYSPYGFYVATISGLAVLWVLIAYQQFTLHFGHDTAVFVAMLILAGGLMTISVLTTITYFAYRDEADPSWRPKDVKNAHNKNGGDEE